MPGFLRPNPQKEVHHLTVRVRMLWYEPRSGLVALVDGDRAVLVDVSLCVTPESSAWVREYLCQLVVLGHLESCEVSDLTYQLRKSALTGIVYGGLVRLFVLHLSRRRSRYPPPLNGVELRQRSILTSYSVLSSLYPITR